MNNGGGTFEVFKSTDGINFTSIDTQAFSGTSYAQYSIDVNDATATHIKVESDDHPGHLIIDDFSTTTFTSGSNPAPSISNITVNPSNPTSSDTVTITAEVTDADGLASVELDYGTTSGSLTTSLPMTIISGDTYSATIPAQADQTTVYYTISATDSNSSPETATTTEASYDVVDPLPAPTLIISEVSDPGNNANARFVEIYNNGNTDIDFSSTPVYIARYANANTSSSNYTLTGTLAAGEYFVLAYSVSNFTNAYGFAPDDNSGIVTGNGDDTYALFVGTSPNATLFDIYGNIGTDGSGQSWEYEDSRAVRNDLSVSPTATWTASQWTISVADVADMTPGAGETTTYTHDNGAWSPANPVGNSTAADDIVIAGNQTPQLTGDIVINNITIQPGGILHLDGNSITAHGDISGALRNNVITGGTLNMVGSSAQTIEVGDLGLVNLTINNSSGVTINNSMIFVYDTLTVTSGVLNTNGGLAFIFNTADDKMGVVAPTSLGSINGNVLIGNFYPAQRAFRFMTPSVDMEGTIYENWQTNGATGGGIGFAITGGAAADGFDQSSTNNPSMFTFSNDNNQDWNAVTSTNNTSTDNPTSGTPYRVMVRGDRTVSLTTANAAATATTVNTAGTLKTGDVVNSFPNVTTDQFAFVGNPYQARVDVGAVLADASAAGFKNMMYVWNPQAGSRGAYRLYDYGSSSVTPADTEVDGVIQPGQAFFLEAQANAPTITFKESHKVAGSSMNATYSVPQAQVVMNLFKANETSARDGFRIQMDGNYNAAIDANDYTKLYNIDENVAIVTAAQSLIFEQRPMA